MHKLLIYLTNAVIVLWSITHVKANTQKDTVVDSVTIYLKKNWPNKKKFEHAYLYTSKQSDESNGYYIRSGHKIFKYASQIQDSQYVGRSLFLIGYGYACKENFTLALDYFFKCLKYVEAVKDTHILMNIYTTIAISYSQQKQHRKAISYIKKTIEIAKQQKSEKVLALCANNIGIEYQNLKEFALSEKYLKQSYAYFYKKGSYKYLPSVLMNRGVTYFERGLYDSALVLYREAKNLHFKYNKEGETNHIYNNLGEIFYKLNQPDSSLYYLTLSLKSIDTLNDKYSTRELYKHLSNVYKLQKKYEKAYYYLNKYTHLNNLIFNDENLKKSLTVEANYVMLQKENELRLLEEKSVFDKKKNFLIYIFGSITAFLLLIALLVMIYRFKEKKKANTLLELQKGQIEEQKREITDSINYAQRIQDSILPSTQTLQQVLHDFILMYKPKDIVGGDFYYVEQIDSRTYFSVIDCTGHGVPGGFMSMLGYNAIQNVLLDLKIKEPAKILDTLAENLVKHFSQQGKKTIRDGMDMAMCCIYEENGKKILEYAGAQNPCWIIKNDNNTVVELKATKQPIGYFENVKPFINHVIEIEKGDTVYLFSDGYADQFGGPNGKKFKYANLKKLILSENNKPTNTIQNALIENFNLWQSDFDQVDDVCILAVRIE